MENSYADNCRVFKYSVNKLIDLVKVRPILWDSSRLDFRSFNKKDKTWREVYAALDDKYRSSDERTQQEIGMRITAKWRNIRDAFMRSFKKRAEHSKVRKYMHHDQLSFMLKLLYTDETAQSPQRRVSAANSETTAENITESEVNTTYDGVVEDPLVTNIKVESDEETTDFNATNIAVVKLEIEDEILTFGDEEYSSLKRSRPEDFESQNDESRANKVQRTEREVHLQPAIASTSNIVRGESNPPHSSPDEDESFFASTLSLVRDMTQDEKLDFRMAVLQLIHDTRARRRMSTSKN